jgi:hypothetical protein
MPIGIQTFDKMVGGEWAYVDKTAIVYELANDATHNFLSRPRRFGKSMLISTLDAYFRGDKKLFKGLAMEELESEWTPHPIFRFDFVDGAFGENIEQTRGFIDDKLSEFEEIWGKGLNESSNGLRFAGLIKRAVEQTGQRAVLLFDEYDKPLTESMHNSELNDLVRSAVTEIFSAVKGSDQYIRFSLLTGVTKFSKVTLFSGVNNLKDISLSKKYAAICGITQEELEDNFEPEIQNLAENTGFTYEETIQKLKEEYNGYHFFEGGPSVYNPFSTINVLSDGVYGNYWYESGTPKILIDELVALDYEVQKFDDGVMASSSEIDEYRHGSTNPVPLIFQSGYLTIDSYDPRTQMYKLVYPNNEVRYGFVNSLMTAITSLSKGSDIPKMSFYYDLDSNDLDSFMRRLSSFFAGMPYDLDNKTEKHYQTIFYVLIKPLGIAVNVEIHSAFGSSDAIIEMDDNIYIFEFKLTKGDTVQEALKQIDDKGYARKYEDDPDEKRPVIKIGVTFDEEKRNIGEWKATQDGVAVGGCDGSE